LRDRLNALLDQVQAAVDLLERQKAEAEAQQEADLQQQAAGLNPNQPTEIPLVQTPPAETPPVENPPAENPPSEGADNLLNGENGDGE
jgi:alpha-ketoglutarate-dependent taurine dioxygenase